MELKEPEESQQQNSLCTESLMGASLTWSPGPALSIWCRHIFLSLDFSSASHHRHHEDGTFCNVAQGHGENKLSRQFAPSSRNVPLLCVGRDSVSVKSTQASFISLTDTRCGNHLLRQNDSVCMVQCYVHVFHLN